MNISNKIKSLLISAQELRTLTSWSEAVIEDYLNLTDNILSIIDEIEGLTKLINSIINEQNFENEIKELNKLINSFTLQVNYTNKIKELEKFLYDSNSFKYYLPINIWNNIFFSVSSGRIPAANAPTWAVLTTNTGGYIFDINDYIDLGGQGTPHSWKESSPGYFHLHLTLPVANVSGGNYYAKFTLYIAYSNISDIWTETSLTAEQRIPNGSVILKIFRLDLGNISLSGLSIKTRFKLRIKRIAATGGAEYPNDIFIQQIGCRLKENTVGSREETYK